MATILRPSWVRRGAIFGLLAGALALGYLSGSGSADLAVAASAAPLVLLFIIWSAQRIEWGVVGILAAAAFVRFSIPTGTESEIVASLLVTAAVVGLWLAKMLVLEKRWRLKPAPTNAPLLAFMAVSVVSLIWGIAYRDPLVTTWGSFPMVQLASLMVMLLLPVVFLLVGNCIADEVLLRAMVFVVLVTGFLGLVGDFLRISIPVNILGIFPMWAVATSYAWALYDRKLKPWQRLLLFAFAAGWILYGYPKRLTWLAAWVPSFAAISVVTFLRWKWSVVIIVLVAALVGWHYFGGATFQDEATQSGETRVAAWTQNWQVTGKHLLFGTGPAGYAAYYMTYYPTTGMATHSNFVDVLAQTGIVGLVFYLWFFGVLVWRGYQICHRLKGRGDFMEGLANAVFAGAVGCVVAMGIGDWMLPFTYTQTIEGFEYVVYNWLFLGMIPVLDLMTRVETKGQSQQKS